MELSTLPEHVVVETTEHKCLQSQFSVLYNEAMQLKTQLEEARNQLQVISKYIFQFLNTYSADCQWRFGSDTYSSDGYWYSHFGYIRPLITGDKPINIDSYPMDIYRRDNYANQNVIDGPNWIFVCILKVAKSSILILVQSSKKMHRN